MAQSTKQREAQIQRMIDNLKCSREEAEQLMADDEAIDHGERMGFDVSIEEEKRRKKLANVDEHKAPKAKTERKRKENPTKGSIISAIATFLAETDEIQVENAEIVNKEREIAFDCDGFNYSIVLTQHRKPKQ